jgi:hypothetical protein
VTGVPTAGQFVGFYWARLNNEPTKTFAEYLRFIEADLRWHNTGQLHANSLYNHVDGVWNYDQPTIMSHVTEHLPAMCQLN